MDADTLRGILALRESETLDFKRDPYPSGAAGHAELAKDVMAIANCLARGEIGRILLGVDEVPDGTGLLVGLEDAPVDDASMQEIVKTRLLPCPAFAYFEIESDGRRAGVLEIRGEGRRPYFPPREAPGLRPNVALVRRGSSTDVASPLEIIQWYEVDNPEKARMRELELERMELARRPIAVLGVVRERRATIRGIPGARAPEPKVAAKIINVGTCAFLVENIEIEGSADYRRLPLGAAILVKPGADASYVLGRGLPTQLTVRVTARSVPHDIVDQVEARG